MPWSPSFANVVPDSRLDPVRNRAARLEHAGSSAGYVLVETDYLAPQLGGLLWWRRWATPQEYAVVLTRMGEDVSEAAVGNADLGIVAVWAADGFTDRGTTYEMVWLDETESERVHREVFAHQH
jgi:hypothetical protein